MLYFWVNLSDITFAFRASTISCLTNLATYNGDNIFFLLINVTLIEYHD